MIVVCDRISGNINTTAIFCYPIFFGLSSIRPNLYLLVHFKESGKSEDFLAGQFPLPNLTAGLSTAGLSTTGFPTGQLSGLSPSQSYLTSLQTESKLLANVSSLSLLHRGQCFILLFVLLLLIYSLSVIMSNNSPSLEQIQVVLSRILLASTEIYDIRRGTGLFFPISCSCWKCVGGI